MLVGPHPLTDSSSYLLHDAMERRGRSRTVSTAAALRKSHQHQRQLYYARYATSSPSSSPSPVRSPDSDDSTSPQSTMVGLVTPPDLTLDYYESPPTPPQSVEDQIHEAYALDNIRLAKILYLKLQGVHVVDDSDPRIEQVREEDFPFGKLVLDEEDERSLKECQKKERHRRRDQQRANKLAQCERAWDQSTFEYRQQCLLVQQRKWAAAPAPSEQQHRPDTEEQHRSRARRSGSGARSLLSCKSLDDVPLHPNPGSSCSLEPHVPTSPSSPVDIPSRSSELRRDSRSIPAPSRSISFRQVSACMNGALFPDDDVSIDLRGRKQQPHTHATLLEVLLQPVTWERGERSEARIGRRSSFPSFSTWSSNLTLCSACSSTSGSPSTLGSSPSSHCGHHSVGVRKLTISTSNLTTCASSPRTRPTFCNAHSLIPVDLQECPLFFQKRSPPQLNAPPATPQPKPRSRFATRLVRKIGVSVSTLMDVAVQLQASYMRTAGFIAQLEGDYLSDETLTPSMGARPPMAAPKANTKSKPKNLLPFDPTNPRAKPKEAAAFIKGSTWAEAEEETDIEEEHYTLVQLLSPSERRNPSPSATSPLSVFIIPSPLRPREIPASLRYRIRPIANPVLLRLKALQNVCAGEGVEWEGRAREGALGFGRDRLQGVAFDGIGRSRLGWEVSF